MWIKTAWYVGIEKLRIRNSRPQPGDADNDFLKYNGLHLTVIIFRNVPWSVLLGNLLQLLTERLAEINMASANSRAIWQSNWIVSIQETKW